MRQQEVHLGRLETQERLVGDDRVVAQFDGAQHPAEQMPVVRPGEALQAVPHRLVATATVGAPPVQVVALLVTVHAHAHRDAVLGEQVEEHLVQQDAVCLDTEADAHVRLRRRDDRLDRVSEVLRAREQRFAPVEHDLDVGNPVRPRVLGDAPRRPFEDLPRHPPGLPPPALVGHLVHVAVVARQVASAVDLEDEVADRRGPPAVLQEPAHVECARPLDRLAGFFIADAHLLTPRRSRHGAALLIL